MIRRALCCLFIGAAMLLTGCGPKPTVTVFVERQAAVERAVSVPDSGDVFILNPSSMRFHRFACVWADRISPERRVEFSGDRETLIAVGYEPCHYCEP